MYGCGRRRRRRDPGRSGIDRQVPEHKQIQKARADLVPGDNGINNGPDFKVTIAGDTLFALDAFQGFPYPFTPGSPCAPD